MKKKFGLNEWLVLILFLACMTLGFWRAANKPLWIDENYSTKAVVMGASYVQMIFGDIFEGNKNPLFYFIQKVVTDLTAYTMPIEMGQVETLVWDLRSQIILRAAPVFFMSLSIVLIFYFFSRYYSLWTGLYSVLISLSSFMVFQYWAEARPYALWVFLTTVQSLLFIYLLDKKGSEKSKAWIGLIVTHFLMVFTVIFSMVQIAFVSLLLFIFYEKKLRKYILFTFIPVVIGLYYYSITMKLTFYFKEGPLALINASISKDRFFILFIFVFYFVCYLLSNSKKGYLYLKERVFTPSKIYMVYFLFTSLMLAAAGVVLFLFKLNAEASPEIPGFQVSNRYLIFLVPVGIIAVTMFSDYMVRMTKNFYVRFFIVVFLGVLLIFRFYRTFALVGIPFIEVR